MAEQVTLSTYLEEIDTRIRKNRTADAIALCKYILRQYPKHLETYSLMARALFAQRDAGAALDIHRRVLSADPENVDAYVDIARILDTRSQLQEAIWHMERAFELSPTRADIRQDLLRLYARVEGKPRERLKLTRVSLARLYVQEGLFTQAIREFRDISLADPSRYDVRVALTEALWRAGQTRQAADVAQSLLEPLPYCLKANLILGTAWRESAIDENESFLQRAQTLDPSNKVAQRLLGDRSPLSLVLIKIPRYDGDVPRLEETKLPATRERTVLEDSGFVIPPLVAPQEKAVPETTQEQEPEPTLPSLQVAETPDNIALEDLSLPIALEELGETPTPAFESLPLLHSEEELPAEMTRAETPTAVESKPEAEEASPDWLMELRKNFAENLGADLPEEATPEPIMNFDEQSAEAELSHVRSQDDSAQMDSDQERGVRAQIEEPPTEQESVSSIVTESSPIEHAQMLAFHVEEPEPDSTLFSDEEATTQVTEQDTRPTDSEEIAQPQSAEMLSTLSEELPTTLEPASSISEEEEAAPVEPEELEMKPEAVPATRVEGMPGWLQGASEEAIIEDKSTNEEMPSWLEGASTEARAEPENPPEVKMPKWVEVLSQPPRESTSEKKTPIEMRSKIEPVTSEEFGQEASSEIAQPEPAMTEPEPLVLAETRPTEPVEPAAMPESPVAQETESALPPIKRQPKYYSRLVQARQHRDENRWSDAVIEYDFVINKAPRLVDEVIMDLEAFVASGDAPLDAHRLLGDAYARAGRLNDALERYRFVYKHVSESE